jgi:hypothetical protein
MSIIPLHISAQEKEICGNNSGCLGGHVKLSDCEMGQRDNALGNFFPADTLAICCVVLLLEAHRGLCFRLYHFLHVPVPRSYSEFLCLPMKWLHTSIRIHG